MILFTTGHKQFQFDYLMRLVAPVRNEFPDDEIIVQYGHIPKEDGIEAVGRFRLRSSVMPFVMRE